MKSCNFMLKSLVLASSLALAACGGGSSGSNTVISGTAEAPSGTVAMLEHKPFVYALADFIFTPVYSAITGLQPVGGATVELIRIDNNGDQIGDVLATTATSITGDYTLELPAGVDLSGDLVVRITGNANTSMSAQVVEHDIDINPITNFVLAKFIDAGADLDMLTTASVVNLKGQVEEFDLTATADLSTMLAALENETGDFVDARINTITAVAGDGASVAGDYTALYFSFGLHDSDATGDVGTFSVDLGVDTFTLSDAGSGSMDATFTSEEGSFTNQIFIAGPPVTIHELHHESEIMPDGELEVETVNYSSNGILSGSDEFEEDIEGDFGWRSPPSSFQLQKAKNADIFFGGPAEAGVRYQTIDTNGDDIKDAIDPNLREGDEVFKGIDVFVKRPASIVNADLDGEFGVVTLTQELEDTGLSYIVVDNLTLDFDGAASTVDISASNPHSLERVYDFSVTFDDTPETEELGVPYSTSASGPQLTIDGDARDGAIGASFNFMALVMEDNDDTSNPGSGIFDSTAAAFLYAVRLPSSGQIDLSGRTYKMLMLTTAMTTTETEVIGLGFNSKLMVDANGDVTMDLEDRSIFKSTILSDVESDSEDETGVALEVFSVDVDGNLSLELNDGTDHFHGDGYISHDGSIGILQVRNFDGTSDPDEIGIMFLIEIDS